MWDDAERASSFRTGSEFSAGCVCEPNRSVCAFCDVGVNKSVTG